MVEHNIVAASQLYANISFEQLARLLSVPAERAERIAGQMISEGRLDAHIDQIDSTLVFSGNELHSLLLERSLFVTGLTALENWDNHIDHLCNTVNQIADEITAAHPQWAETQIERFKIACANGSGVTQMQS